jgi:hypothetical protein
MLYLFHSSLYRGLSITFCSLIVVVEQSTVSFIVCFGPEVFIVVDAETFCGHPSLNSGNEWLSNRSPYGLSDGLQARHYT